MRREANTVDFAQWSARGRKAAPPKKKDKYYKYPFFVQCSNVVTDPYWKKIFTDMGTGRCPHGFYIEGNTLYKKNKKSPIPLDIRTDVAGASRDIIEFFHSVGGIFSPAEVSKERQERALSFENMPKVYYTWGEANNRMRADIIFFFAQKEAEEKSLTKQERDALIRTIYKSILLKELTPKMITCTDNRIEEIKNLEWDPETREYYIIQKSRKREVTLDSIPEPTGCCRIFSTSEYVPAYAKMCKELRQGILKSNAGSKRSKEARGLDRSESNFSSRFEDCDNTDTDITDPKTKKMSATRRSANKAGPSR